MGGLCASAQPLSAGQIATAFTYQGQLKVAGLPAEGAFDMSFSLYDAAGGGDRRGGPLVFDGMAGNAAPVAVAKGLFQVALDFGAVFDGTQLWLQVEVRPHGDSAYTPLSPRQALTAAPLALYALGGPGGSSVWTANGSDIHNTNTGRVGIGTDTPTALLHVAGDIRSDGTLGLAAHNPGNGDAVAALGWFNDVARIRIGGNGAGASNGLDIQRTGDRSLMRILHNGNVGIGTIDPGADLHVVGDGAQTALRVTNSASCSGSTNTGLIVGDVCGSGRAATFYGVTSSTLVTIANDGSGLAAGFGGDVVFSGDVGVGASSPSARLHVDGGSDAAPSRGGYIVAGDVDGLNLAIDNNEIMARNNGVAAPLYLNAGGGEVVLGGPLDIGYEIVTGGGSALCPGGKRPIAGGCQIGGDAEVRASFPYNNGWPCEVGDQSGFITLRTYVICVNIK